MNKGAITIIGIIISIIVGAIVGFVFFIGSLAQMMGGSFAAYIIAIPLSLLVGVLTVYFSVVAIGIGIVLFVLMVFLIIMALSKSN